MNPFIDSTVARPVPDDHRDHCWRHPNKEQAVPLRQPRHLPSANDDALDHSDPAADAQGCRQRRSVVKRLSRGALSMLIACSAGAGLFLSSTFGTVPGSVVVTGSVVVLGSLVAQHASAMDLNSASAQDLQTLKGIGPKTAQMIIDERSRGGNYTSLSDLSDRVRGIGPKKAGALQAAGLKVVSGQGKGGAANAPSKESRSARK